MTLTAPETGFTVGALVRARDREWVVLPGSTEEFLLLQPLGGGPEDVAGVFPDEGVASASFPAPSPDDLGDAASAGLLRTALRVGFRTSAGPFRSLAGISVTPRQYQLVPLMMALRQDTVRLLIADDVGIGKTVEAGLIAAELLAQGTVSRLAVLCSPALAEQWQTELRVRFGLDAALVLTGTVRALERDLMLNESLFERHPYVIVSTDFIKSDRRRHEFLQRCPELVIVDEAHSSVAADDKGRARSSHQRYELLRQLAADPSRHLLLLSATPHSGDDQAFRNLLGLLDPALAEIDLSGAAGRERLAGHLVQRRRADIRHFLDEDTPFPSDRQTRDVPYQLSPAYRALFDDVLAYAREQVRDGADTARGRIRWWSALALLRALASSPRAAAATLRTRAANAEAVTAAEADALGRAGVLDASDDEALEGIDATPGAQTDDDPDVAPAGQRRRLLDFALRADALDGPDADRKLAALTTEVGGLLADGFDPIVFCRFISTAEYVGTHLTQALARKRGASPTVAVVTGQLPPDERRRRIADLTSTEGRRVLVATDCLSEGVNLQEGFSAVLHYDLAWNPTRHEQREGRVDRFGQQRDIVRAVTLYGSDNAIDGIVLEVLIRKHRAIAKATGVAVPVPGDGTALIEALAEGLLLRGRDHDQLTLDIGLDSRAQALDTAWASAAEAEKVSRSRFAQHGIKPDEVAAQMTQVRAALGAHGDLRHFVAEALTSLGSTVRSTDDGGLTATVAALPLGIAQTLPLTLRDPAVFHPDPPAPPGQATLQRTDPAVQALARYVLDAALDAALPASHRPARRGGVIRSRAVTTRTTVLLVRSRFELTLPSRSGTLQQVAEDARVLAFEGSPTNAVWLPDARAEELLRATPDGNIPADAARIAAARVIDALGNLEEHLEAVATEQAARLYQAHRGVREAAKDRVRGLAVIPNLPVDVLSVHVLLPAADAGGVA